MCGIAGIVAIDRLDRRAPRARRDARHPCASRTGRSRAAQRRPTPSSPPPSEHRRSRHRPAAAVERRRHGLGRLQRGDLQPRAGPARPREHGHRYRTKSDTETIVHAYEQWGDDCVHRFRGMFAFADLGCAEAPAAPRARSAGRQAVLLGEARGPAALRIGDQGHSRQRPRRSASQRSRPSRSCSARVTSPAPTRSSEASRSCCPANSSSSSMVTRASGSTGTCRSRTLGRACGSTDVHGKPRDVVARFRGLLRGIRPSSSHERRAARRVPVRRHRQQRRSPPSWRRLIDRPLQTFSVAFEERAFNELAYAREVAKAIGAEASRSRHQRSRVLWCASDARLARGRADRPSVERAAVFRVGARATSTSPSC